MARTRTLRWVDGCYAVCRLGPHAPVPPWLDPDSAWMSITRTRDELSIICQQEIVPDHVECQRDWRMIMIEGPFEFSEIGVLRSVVAPLADDDIPVLAVCTFETDYLLVEMD